MASINKQIIVGRIGKDPELRRTPGGAAVLELSVATTDVSKNADGTKREETEWHTVIVWNKAAEFIAQYGGKGRLVYVEGRTKTRNWDDANGKKCYKTEVQANTVDLLDKNPNQNTNADGFNQAPQGSGFGDFEPPVYDDGQFGA